MEKSTISPQILKAARALVGISSAELARRSGLSRPTLEKFEQGLSPLSLKSEAKILTQLQLAGVKIVQAGEKMVGDGVCIVDSGAK